MSEQRPQYSQETFEKMTAELTALLPSELAEPILRVVGRAYQCGRDVGHAEGYLIGYDRGVKHRRVKQLT